ncbi:hypothetical protein J5N97_003246 [Dioscorea zingiberensis]|uniref:Cytochrome c oxidase copper chaperone n=1 Tax=Dioscorea zingiberensis TaxID=325984 RepID=A0A9D5D3R7_9LILI|nr:hypothetical protein J5N97_003246 [Dioscorea zingiberensis]
MGKTITPQVESSDTMDNVKAKIKLSDDEVKNGNSSGISSDPPASLAVSKDSVEIETTQPKPKKKICCACPDTKRLRDECIVTHGEAACTKWIEAHKKCLRVEGFNV